MTASPQSSNSLTAAFPSFRSVSPLPSLLRSAAASSSSSLSSLFQFTSAEIDPQYSTSDEVRSHQSIITQAFSPTVAVIASRECEEVIHEKGFTNFLDLIRPFGDRVQGKVNIRDSQALSIPVEDFSMKFVDFQLLAQSTTNGREEHGPYAPKRTTPAYISGGDLAAIERVLEGYAEEANTEYEEGSEGSGAGLYSYFLRKVLSGMPLSAHETFSHPVACVLAVSTRHPEPIDALLGLYNTTNNAPIPRYIDAGFLRYYVLIHDEDKDDIDKYLPITFPFSLFRILADATRSNTILEKMKRSLGLHCTLLRLSSTPSKDTTPLSKSIWLSAGEELLSLSNPTPLPNISSFDREALIKFTRDLATQSIIPHMERCISTWNDQIASYRRGLAGRVFTASRRLFSSSSRSATPTSGTGNYDVSSSSYPPATPEAQMRKLADYAFMLRDFRLAHSTYDIVRKDFVNDKAWKYAAGAQVHPHLLSICFSD
jgi:trafficking protein particle complex subunit 8